MATLIAESAANTPPPGAPASDGRSGIRLRRSIGLWQLAAIGISSTIGTGIFFVLSSAVPQAGPAVVISFVIVAIAAGLTALCYAELASAIPVAGSSYSYAYATLGEIVAFGVGACLLLEYGVSASATAVSWGQYLNEFFGTAFGFTIPEALAAPPGDGGYFNLPSVILVAMCCLLLVRGSGESARVNAIMVAVKITVLVLFVAIGLTGFHSGNLHPFMPLGMTGVGVAASSIFFSFIGMDAISTAGEEVRNPRRTMPVAIILTLVVVTVLYLGVAVTAVAAQPWQKFNGQEAGLAQILQDVTGSSWPATMFALGAVISIFSVTLVTIYGQTRILFSMGRDGMLPPRFAKVSPRTGTPVWNTLVVGSGVALLAAFVPLDELTDLTSMGTLVAFTVVSAGVIILRRKQPELERGFKVPGYPVTPVLSIAFCLYLIYGLHVSTFVMFGAWLAGAAAIYFGYGIRHSRLAQQPAASATAASATAASATADAGSAAGGEGEKAVRPVERS
ncbi:amino acid permease [Streptomyces sp. RB6PN25]|uniref:Amino acid permease n=1 Tax=Streptomyces humicola TaxID=2953240 RepID=A0ABT1PQN1_9ACTN|nr:amino acid permease [Streptomyces humicola]MCQ4079981.1 amino acid permease [Streptomyces humicola]